jgi:hypothetical protein
MVNKQQQPTPSSNTTQKFTDNETNKLLRLRKEFLRCGKPEWEYLAVEFNKLEGVRVRSYDNMRLKFNALAGAPPSTGTGEIPKEVLLAKEIRELMIRNP